MDLIHKVLGILGRNAVRIIPEESLVEKLKSGRPLTVKLGCDPSRPDLHLGHSVVLKKLRDFQDLGHRVVLIVGDFTAMIGDPSGRSKTRPALSLEETRRNGQSYVDQATLILDPDPARLSIRYNSEWLGEMSFKEVVSLAGKQTVARMLERDDFETRYRNGEPIGIHEFLYPLAQAYDSVQIRSDVEIGGTDQTFNLLLGREIQREYGLEPQVVLTMPLLVGLDGKEKMSKSLGNYVALTDRPDVMFEKLMKVPDHLLRNYTEFLLTPEAAQSMRNEPIEDHRILARAVVSQYYSDADVRMAESRYSRVADGELPDAIGEISVPSAEFDADGRISLARLAVLGGLAVSNGDARRMILNRGLKLDGSTVEDPQMQVHLTGSVVLQKGKRQFVRIRSEN